MDMAELAALQQMGTARGDLLVGRLAPPPAVRWHSPRAALKARMVELEERIAGAATPNPRDVAELAAVGAAVAQGGQRSSRWLQKARAQALLVSLQTRLLSQAEPQSSDFVKLVLAAAVLSRETVHASPQALVASYHAAEAQVNEHVVPKAEHLVQMALAGAAWAQGGPLLTAAQLQARRNWVRERVLAYRCPQPQDFLELAVLEVAVQAAEHERLALAAN